ncbi:replication-associated recombination protein A [Pseudomaricurvus alkylphenolicus]|uniref:replication-associated recombination protein A n=1 Tax=Pseudomaricurvus alkylphenolicus TaxID=1306991 RepID=UPI001422B39C|nr:replication-associated recombination protein A [Pseudomaricurvus alkylphenolicus]NIB41167.1 replication-associated recombination protein A [Pseudomaricurvus alkylphenolicus]
MSDLFTSEPVQPLAARMRPRHPDDYVGQEHLFAEGKPLREAIVRQQLHSMVLWGPPGVGKTSMARMIAEISDAHFETVSAVLAGVKEIRAAVATAQQLQAQSGRRTILFVDEVHRFNKSQQDAFLPFVEDGTVIFIGATTENPSFSLNNALLSRCRVYLLRGLEHEHLMEMLRRALSDSKRGLGEQPPKISQQLLSTLAHAADGDGRKALNLLEVAFDLAEEGTDGPEITEAVVQEILANDVRRFDNGGDVFYEQISALHKSVRGSNVDGALYWLARMLDGGCDPLYIARRVVRMASEDIGNADPRALQLCLNAWETQERLGSPEGELAIAQAVVYLAAAPKSNAVYKAFNEAMADVKSQPSFDVPIHLRNAPTQLMKNLDYGREYRYAHDEPGAYAAGEVYFPEELEPRRYYRPTDRGLEQKIGAKLKHLGELDELSDWRRYQE